MPQDQSNGFLNTALANLLTGMQTLHQAVGRVEATQVANRQTVLDTAQSLHLRMEDLRGEVFRRIDHIETAKTKFHIPWWVIFRAMGFVLSTALLIGGHLTVDQFKQILGFTGHH